MNNPLLTDLVETGTIKSYHYVTVNGDTNEEGSSSPRGCNYERLVLEFNNGKKLKIDTTCSGVLENTHLFFEDDNENYRQLAR